jgi:hypothetical protein
VPNDVDVAAQIVELIREGQRKPDAADGILNALDFEKPFDQVVVARIGVDRDFQNLELIVPIGQSPTHGPFCRAAATLMSVLSSSMRGEAVPQRVRLQPLLDLGHLGAITRSALRAQRAPARAGLNWIQEKHRELAIIVREPTLAI